MRVVVTGGRDADADELAFLTGQLRRRLLELDVEDVRHERSGLSAPQGAKSGELIAVGALVVSLAPTLLPPVLGLVETWMRSRPVRTVKIEADGRVLELGHASPEQQQRLVEAFLAGAEAGPAAGASTAPATAAITPGADGEAPPTAAPLPGAGSS